MKVIGVFVAFVLPLFSDASSRVKPEHILAKLDIYALPDWKELSRRFGEPKSTTEETSSGTVAKIWQLGACRLKIAIPKPDAPSYVHSITVEGTRDCKLRTGRGLTLGMKLAQAARLYRVVFKGPDEQATEVPSEIIFGDNSRLFIAVDQAGAIRFIRVVSSD